jgi:hypothetical protein
MSTLRIVRRGAIASAVLGLAACGGDGGTGPSGSFDLTGQWVMTASELATFGRTCTMPPITLTFTSTNGTLGGTMLPGGDRTMVCTGDGIGVEANPLPGLTTFDDVRVNGTRVTFSIDGDPSSVQGNGGWTIVGDTDGNARLIGSAIAFRIPIGPDANYLTTTGIWTAQRQ